MMTMGNSGAEGVITAITDGMQAGRLAHEMEERQAEYENAALNFADQNAELMAALRSERVEKTKLIMENQNLRRMLWEYRRERSRAYSVINQAQREAAKTRDERQISNIVSAMIGFAAALLVALVVVWIVK